MNLRESNTHIRQVFRLSLPAILTQITTIAMQYIDSAMVGNLGANASAAIGLVASTTWLFNGINYGVSAGFSVQVAHSIGAMNIKKAKNVVDIIFNPRVTKLLADAKSNMNGLFMLVGQAVKAEEIWQNKRYSNEVKDLLKRIEMML